MKIKSLFLFMMLISVSVFGQINKDTIPLVSLRDALYIADSVGATWPAAPMTGKIIRVRGHVVARPVVGGVNAGEGNRNPVIWFGSKWGTYIQGDPTDEFSGLNIYGGVDSTNALAQATLLDLCDTAATYEFTGTLTMFGQTPELVLLTSPEAVPVELVSQETERPAPIPVKLIDGYQQDGTSFEYRLRKYQGMYVELVADANNPLIVSDIVTGTGSSAGGFRINDGNGHYWLMYAQSRYYKTGSTVYRERPDWNPPAAGSLLSYVRGILEVYNNQWEIVPVYPQDMGPTLISPPAISSVKRTPGVVSPTDDVQITCTVKGVGADYVTEVKLMKRVNMGALDSLVMTRGTGADSVNYSATIPALNVDSAFVDYYVKATASNGLTSTNPLAVGTSRFSYFVLNRPLTLQDVRYSPFGSGYSSYNGYKVTVTGVVVADTSDIPGNHGSNPPRVYIQNGSGPWSGIMLGSKGPNGSLITNLKRGDLVTVTGYPLRGAYGTAIDTLDAFTVTSSGNPLPDAQVLPIDSVGILALGALSAEPWNGCIVRYENIVIDSANADGTSNFGESYGMNPGGTRHSRIIWSEGNTSFNAGASAVKVNKGDSFTSITGILGYTHSYYKLCPRKDDDIVGYTPTDVQDIAELPKEFVLNQNYPNPFNPSTIISYSLPKASAVTLKIFNVLGQEVRTLVNRFENAGTHQVNFNASSLSTGIYFYSIQAGDYMQVKKMMLIK